MPNYVTIATSVWNDSWFNKQSLAGKLLWYYLIIPTTWAKHGIIEVDFKRVTFDTGLAKAQIRKQLIGFEADNKIVIDGSWLWVVNFTAYQNYNPKAMQGAATEVVKLSPKTPLAKLWLEHYTDIAY